MNNKRRLLINSAINSIDLAIEKTNNAFFQESNCYDNIPENLCDSDTATKMEDAIDNMYEALDMLSDAKDLLISAKA